MERKSGIDPVSAYLEARSGRVAAQKSFYGNEASALRIVRTAEVEIGAPGRNPTALDHRIALAKLYIELGEGVSSAWRLLNSISGYTLPFSEATAYRIIRDARGREEEFQPRIFAVAAIVEKPDGSGQMLSYRELTGRPYYGKLIGDLTVPMGLAKGPKEPDTQALRRVVRWELFDGNKVKQERWLEIFELPFGSNPIGHFAVVDCLVSLYILRLHIDEAELGGFSSKKVEGHAWTFPHLLLANSNTLRDGVPEMVSYYREFIRNPSSFDRRDIHLTALNHAIANIL